MSHTIISTLILLVIFNFGNSNPISLNINDNNIQANEKSLQLNITLSNNDLIKVNISFELMSQRRNPTVQESISTTTAKGIISNTDDDDDDDVGFTADDAIELFQTKFIDTLI